MNMLSRGGFGDLYEGELCQEFNDLHVFHKKLHFTTCECGLRKTVVCECECGDFHRKAIPTTTEERMAHELLRLQFRVGFLESGHRSFMEGIESSAALKNVIADMDQ